MMGFVFVFLKNDATWKFTVFEGKADTKERPVIQGTTDDARA